MNIIHNQEADVQIEHPANSNTNTNTLTLQTCAESIVSPRKGSFTASQKNTADSDTSGLTKSEVVELERCETIIKKGNKVFIEVGRALMSIRDSRLYRDEFKSFEVYCDKKWGFGRAHAYRFIDAASVIASLSPIGDKKTPLPTCESQVRELVGLPTDIRNEVWTQAVMDAGDKPVTATVVKAAAASFKSRTQEVQKTPLGKADTGALASRTRAGDEISGNDKAIEAADSVVTYLRGINAKKLASNQLNDWLRLLKQLTGLITDLEKDLSNK